MREEVVVELAIEIFVALKQHKEISRTSSYLSLFISTSFHAFHTKEEEQEKDEEERNFPHFSLMCIEWRPSQFRAAARSDRIFFCSCLLSCLSPRQTALGEARG